MAIPGRTIGAAMLLMCVTALVTWFLALGYLRDSNDRIKGGKPPQPNQEEPLPQSSKTTRPDKDSDKSSGQSRINRTVGQGAQSTGDLSKDEFRNLINVAAANGDFAPLGKFFDDLSQAERYQYFKEIPAVFSKLGPSHDIGEKMALLDKVNVPASTLTALRGTVLDMEARERYDQMKDEGVLETLSDKEFAGVCRSIASSRVKQGFVKVEDARSESAKRAAAAEVARCAIAGGTMEASKEIGMLPPGVIRDEAAVELVLWLRRTGSEDDAAAWVKTIMDEKAKARLEAKK